MNRAGRRAQEHGRDQGDHVQDNLLTEAQNQAGSTIPPGEEPGPGGLHESEAGDTRMTGAGTGGAVESDGRLPHHEGMHLPNVPNA